MTITIQPELESWLLERANAEGLSADAYVEQLIRENTDWDALNEDDLQFGEIHAAGHAGLEHAEANQVKPANEVFAELRAKHGIAG